MSSVDSTAIKGVSSSSGTMMTEDPTGRTRFPLRTLRTTGRCFSRPCPRTFVSIQPQPRSRLRTSCEPSLVGSRQTQDPSMTVLSLSGLRLRIRRPSSRGWARVVCLRPCDAPINCYHFHDTCGSPKSLTGTCGRRGTQAWSERSFSTRRPRGETLRCLRFTTEAISRISLTCSPCLTEPSPRTGGTALVTCWSRIQTLQFQCTQGLVFDLWSIPQ